MGGYRLFIEKNLSISRRWIKAEVGFHRGYSLKFWKVSLRHQGEGAVIL